MGWSEDANRAEVQASNIQGKVKAEEKGCLQDALDSVRNSDVILSI